MRQIVVIGNESQNAVTKDVNKELEKLEGEELEIYDIRLSATGSRVMAMIVYDDGRSQYASQFRQGQGA